jgi:hypothetical protein
MKFCLRLLLLSLLLLVSACQRGLDPVAFHADGRPPKLSDWHVVEVRDGKLVLNQGVVPYDLNTPLFTDYAHKLRTIWMPKGVSAKYDPTDTFDFPVGTVISKTFYYPRGASGKFTDVERTYDSSRDFAGEGLDLASVHLVETRILVRRESGWAAIPYVWKDDQSDAELARTGAVIPLTLVSDNDAREDFNYVVPDGLGDPQDSSDRPQGTPPQSRLSLRGGRGKPARAPDEGGLSHRRTGTDAGTTQCELDGRSRLARCTCPRVPRHQLRPLPQPKGRGQYHRPHAGCHRLRRSARGLVQATGSRRTRHWRPFFRYRAGVAG